MPPTGVARSEQGLGHFCVFLLCFVDITCLIVHLR